MTKAGDRVPECSDEETNCKPIPDWLTKVPLPSGSAGPAPIAAQAKQSRTCTLVDVWTDGLRRHSPSKYHYVGTKEARMLENLGRLLGEQARELVAFVIPHWDSFACEAKRSHGIYGSQPADPVVWFFVRYHDCAVNLLLQSIAKKKQEDERKARMQSQHEHAEKGVDMGSTPSVSNTQKHTPATLEQAKAIIDDFFAEIAVINSRREFLDTQLAKGEISVNEYEQSLRELKAQPQG